MKGRRISRGAEVSEFTEKALILLNWLLPINRLLNNQLDMWTSTDLSSSCSVLNASIVEGKKIFLCLAKLFHQQQIKKAIRCILQCSGFMATTAAFMFHLLFRVILDLFHFIMIVYTFKNGYFNSSPFELSRRFYNACTHCHDRGLWTVQN